MDFLLAVRSGRARLVAYYYVTGELQEGRRQSAQTARTTEEGLVRFPSRSWEPKHRRNGKIRAREVRVIDDAKQQLGVMSLTDALRLAQSKGMDLIETVPNAVPPVCRIGEYGKLLYEEAKRSKESHKHPGQKMKELQLTPNIEAHDFTTKVNHAIEFLNEDMKVRVKLRFRGRQKAHKEFGFQIINKFLEAAAAYGQADAPPKLLGDRDLNVVISPLSKEKRGKGARPPKASPAGSATVAATEGAPSEKSSAGSPSGDRRQVAS